MWPSPTAAPLVPSSSRAPAAPRGRSSRSAWRAETADQCVKLVPSMAPLIIGIAGGTGSGKTTLARNLVEKVPSGRAVVIEHDWYYRDRSHLTPAERAAVNFDEPD